MMKTEHTDRIVNRKRVHLSMWVPLVAVFFLIILAGGIKSLDYNQSIDIIDLIGLAAMALLLGAVVWLPSAILCLIIERVGINERSTKSHIMQLLFLEALIPFTIFNGLINRGDIAMGLITLTMAMMAQTARWFYLTRKGKLYINHGE